jgi:hypothetical protein
MTDEVVALAVLRPPSGGAVPGDVPITADTLERFAPDPAEAEAVAAALTNAGFRAGPLVGIALSLSGPRAAFEEYFGVPVRESPEGGWTAGDADARELPVPAELAERVQAVTFEPPAEAVSTT